MQSNVSSGASRRWRGSNSQILQETSQQPILQHWDEDANISRNEIMFQTSCKPPISTNRKIVVVSKKRSESQVGWPFPFQELGNYTLETHQPGYKAHQGENLDVSETYVKCCLSSESRWQCEWLSGCTKAFKKNTKNGTKLYPTHPEERQQSSHCLWVLKALAGLVLGTKQMDDESAAFFLRQRSSIDQCFNMFFG